MAESSPGEYRGRTITSRDPAKVSAEIAAIDRELGPMKTEVPGVGTLTVTKKGIPTAPPAADENVDGLHERTGVPRVDPPARTPGGATSPSVPGLPGYPTKATPQSAALEAYQGLSADLDEIEKRITSASTPGKEELNLTKELSRARERLNSFDLGTLEASENLRGQGRGATVGTINTRDTVLSRTRALERLGFAQEANTLAEQLALAKENRSNMGQLAQTEYSLATKRLDIALGIQSEIKKLDDEDKDDARQYLLDVVDFAAGKTYDQLDTETQQAITDAVARSPITLDMVRTALAQGAATGELRSVSGVGVVRINTDGTYTVVVPEDPEDSSSPAPDAPSFNEYLAQQNLPTPSLTTQRIEQLRQEYDAKYGAGSSVSLGKPTQTNKNELAQAGLSNAPTPVQTYFLNAPSEFRDEISRQAAAGTPAPATMDAIVAAYTKWYDSKKKKSDSRDWSAIINGGAQ